MKNKFTIYIYLCIIFLLLFICLFFYNSNYIEGIIKYNSTTVDNNDTLNTKVLKYLGYKVKVHRESLLDLLLPDDFFSPKTYFINGKIATSIDIPETYTYKKHKYTITKVKRNIFNGCVSVKNISLPNTITEIEEHAFHDCTNLEEINIPNTITIIEKYAFCKCKSLKYINIPKNLKKIEQATFWDCKNLKDIDIPNSVTEIETQAFHGCTSLNLKIPNNVTKIGANAFLNVPHIEYHGTATGAPWGAKKIN